MMDMYTSMIDKMFKDLNKYFSNTNTFSIEIHHNIKDYSEFEWLEICSKRVELTQQDPDALMCYEVFV